MGQNALYAEAFHGNQRASKYRVHKENVGYAIRVQCLSDVATTSLAVRNRLDPFGWLSYRRVHDVSYLNAIGLTGPLTDPVMMSVGATKKNSYLPSAAQSSARSFR